MIVCAAFAAAIGQVDNVLSKSATIPMMPGVTVVRNGRTLPTNGEMTTLMHCDQVSISSEGVCMITPDNSIVNFHTGSKFWVDDNPAGREEYVLTAGSFDIWSCPHDASADGQQVSFRTCCIRTWYPDQKDDIMLHIKVVGHEMCETRAKSGIVYRQKTKGRKGYGAVVELPVMGDK